jgi:hypothetical protein
MKTLEELLKTKVRLRNDSEFTPDFRIAVQTAKDGGQHIIVHPWGHSGDTLAFVVKGNELTPYRVI